MPIVTIIIIKRFPPSEAAQIPGNVHGLVPFPSTRLEALWAMSPKLRAGSCAKQAQKNGGSTLWIPPKIIGKNTAETKSWWNVLGSILIFGPTLDVCTEVYIVWTCFTFFSLSPALLVATPSPTVAWAGVVLHLRQLSWYQLGWAWHGLRQGHSAGWRIFFQSWWAA